jgi:hypothetical protein
VLDESRNRPALAAVVNALPDVLAMSQASRRQAHERRMRRKAQAPARSVEWIRRDDGRAGDRDVLRAQGLHRPGASNEHRRDHRDRYDDGCGNCRPPEVCAHHLLCPFGS